MKTNKQSGGIVTSGGNVTIPLEGNCPSCTSSDGVETSRSHLSEIIKRSLRRPNQTLLASLWNPIFESIEKFEIKNGKIEDYELVKYYLQREP